MNAVGWFEIYVDDMNRAKKFYESVFLRKLEKLETPMPEVEMLSFAGDMKTYGANGCLVKKPGVSTGGNSTLVYFSCEDCAIEEKRVSENNGKVSKSKVSIGHHGFISLVFDTEGNMFGLHSLK